MFNRENPQNSEPQNGPGRGLDFIALPVPVLVTGEGDRGRFSEHFNGFWGKGRAFSNGSMLFGDGGSKMNQ